MSAAFLSLALLAALAGGDLAPAPEASRPPTASLSSPLQLRILPLGESAAADDLLAQTANARHRRWHLIAFPMLSYRSDDGPGVGGVISAGYQHDGLVPFSGRLRLRAAITTKLVQRHELLAEGTTDLGIPLSARVALGWYSTRSAHFCGVGNGVTCSEDAALAAVGGSPDDPDTAEIIDKYYRVRFMEPYLETEARARVWDGALAVDTFGRLRGVYHLPGQLGDHEPYPGSLYARAFPKGERGLVIVPELGVALDTRDVPALPTRGMYLESSARASTTAWGSQSNFGGWYGSAARWWHIGGPGRAVLGTRVLVDTLVGDVPTYELARTGGSDPHAVFGGAWIGRGIREARYLGKLKVIPQLEMRTSVLHLWWLRTDVDIGVGFFSDVAWIGADWNDLAGPGGDVTRLLWTVGAGLRILINEDNVMRFDVAISPFEERGPQLYGYSGKTGVQP